VLIRHDRPGLVDLKAERDPHVTVLESRIHVAWSGWSMTEAMLEALRVARAVPGCTHIVLISGQDYPVRNLAAWEAEVVASGVDTWLAPVEPAERHVIRYVWREPSPGARTSS